MEFCDGGDLISDMIKRKQEKNPYTSFEIIDFVQQFC